MVRVAISVDVALVAVFGRVAGHRFPIAAHVEMRTVLGRAIQLTRLLEHAVLDISLVRAIAREGDIEPSEDAILQPLLPLELVEEVAAEIALAEEQPGAAGCGSRLPLLKERTERRAARSPAHHHDGHL